MDIIKLFLNIVNYIFIIFKSPLNEGIKYKKNIKKRNVCNYCKKIIK